MITAEVAERVLPAAFTAQADASADPQIVLATVRNRTRKQRSTRPVLLVAAVTGAVAAVTGISAAVANLPINPAPSGQQISPAAGSNPGLDQLSGTCLDMAKVLTLWESDTGYGGVGSGDGCSVEADTIQATHPEITSSLEAGNRTVYFAEAPAGIRAGFIALTPAESTAAIKASGRPNTTGGPQFLIVAIPDDNPQAVLVSILTQYSLPN